MSKKLQVFFSISGKLSEVIEFDLPSHTKSVQKIWVIENNKPCQSVFKEQNPIIRRPLRPIRGETTHHD